MTDPSMFMPREPVTLVCEVCKAECDMSDQMPTEAILQQYAGMGDRMICEECAGLAPTEPAPPRVHEGDMAIRQAQVALARAGATFVLPGGERVEVPPEEQQKVADVIQFVRPNRRERRTISAKARRNA
jgi:hypothetical protein